MENQITRIVLINEADAKKRTFKKTKSTNSDSPKKKSQDKKSKIIQMYSSLL